MKRVFFASVLFIMAISIFIAPSVNTTDSGSRSGYQASELRTFYASDLSKTVYNDVSEAAYFDLIREFSEIGPKPEGSANNEATKTWIISKLDALSNGKVTSEVRGSYESIVGKLPGALGDDAPCVIIGGHFDTVNVAPGANDDGSGVATALELVRVLSKHEWPLDIYFGFWNAEETGLHGSAEIARQFRNQDMDILIYINIDMLLLQDPSRPSDEQIFVIYNDGYQVAFHSSKFWAELMRAMGNNYDNPVILPLSSTQTTWWAYSDHYSFVGEGYDNVVFASQTEHNDPYYHTSNDKWDTSAYNYTVATQAVASIGAAVAYAQTIPRGELVHEQHSITIPAGSEKEILVEMSLVSWIGISGTWTGAEGTMITARNPSGTTIGSQAMASTDDLLNVTTTELGLHSIIIDNQQAVPINVMLELEYDTDIRGNAIPDSKEWWDSEYVIDSDGDGISNADELNMGSDPYSPDGDNDGLSDYDELFVYGTSPMNNDSDYDDMPDFYEIQVGLDPTQKDGRFDHDDDDLISLFEYGNGTMPFNPDSDGDGMTDGWELENGLNPLANDATEDPDSDGMVNLQEFLSRHDPFVADYVKSTTSLGIEEWFAIIASIGVFLVLIRFLWKMRGSS